MASHVAIPVTDDWGERPTLKARGVGLWKRFGSRGARRLAADAYCRRAELGGSKPGDPHPGRPSACEFPLSYFLVPFFVVFLASSAGVRLFRALFCWLSLGTAPWQVACRGILNPVLSFRESVLAPALAKKRKISTQK